MATQYSFKETFTSPEFEYQVEELRKKLHGSVANFAQIRYRKSMQMRMSIVNGEK